ncbi:MAG: hypothetical protein ACFE8A_03050 [Candidatus Hodarchaeota archaeon]
MPYNVAFDLSHKPRGKIDENYTELRDHLNANDFVCYNFLETPITQESLKIYDILVFVCPDYAKITPPEILEIVNWVKEEGGGLLLLSHAGGDKGRSSNLSELSENFGISFENDQVLDEMSNNGMENIPIITAANFTPPHPITNGINEICFRAGCSLTVLGGAISVVSSNETSDPFSSPLICVAELENGRVCATGSYEMFRDRTGGGFQTDEHARLALNIFEWLLSEHRKEITQYGTVHAAPTAPAQPNSTQLTEQFTSPYSSDIDTQSIDSTTKFSSKEELTSLLNTYLLQINTIKNNIKDLIKNINIYGDAIFKQGPQTDEVAEGIQDSYQTIESGEQETNSLSPLPTKPPDLKKEVKKGKAKSKEVFIGLEPVEYKERDTIEKVSDIALAEIIKKKKKKKAKPKDKVGKAPKGDREKLELELEGLESKLNSAFNLINFIEKKHESGKLDDNSYEKQTRKLQNDLEQTKKRIAEIRNILES